MLESSEGKRVPPDPRKWKCPETGAEDNLWLNLSDGVIGSGRANWDGSGGNGRAGCESSWRFDWVGGLGVSPAGALIGWENWV